MPNKPDIFAIDTVHKHEGEALRALQKGEADPDQQKAALAMIVNKLSRPHDLLYSPGSFDETGFLNGRAFVGQQILKYLNVPVSKLPTLKTEED